MPLKQEGWNCFDIAVDLGRGLDSAAKDTAEGVRVAFVAYALSRVGDPSFREMLGTEIYNAVMIKLTDPQNVAALPANVLSGEALDDIEMRSGKIQFLEERVLSLRKQLEAIEKDDSIIDKEAASKDLIATLDGYIEDIADSKKDIMESCESATACKKYINEYYGKFGWFVVNADFKGGESTTSMIEVAAQYLRAKIVIHDTKGGRDYETADYGDDKNVIHVQYNGTNHFEAVPVVTEKSANPLLAGIMGFNRGDLKSRLAAEEQHAEVPDTAENALINKLNEMSGHLGNYDSDYDSDNQDDFYDFDMPSTPKSTRSAARPEKSVVELVRNIKDILTQIASLGDNDKVRLENSLKNAVKNLAKLLQGERFPEEIKSIFALVVKFADGNKDVTAAQLKEQIGSIAEDILTKVDEKERDDVKEALGFSLKAVEAISAMPAATAASPFAALERHISAAPQHTSDKQADDDDDETWAEEDKKLAEEKLVRLGQEAQVAIRNIASIDAANPDKLALRAKVTTDLPKYRVTITEFINFLKEHVSTEGKKVVNEISDLIAAPKALLESIPAIGASIAALEGKLPDAEFKNIGLAFRAVKALVEKEAKTAEVLSDKKGKLKEMQDAFLAAKGGDQKKQELGAGERIEPGKLKASPLAGALGEVSAFFQRKFDPDAAKLPPRLTDEEMKARVQERNTGFIDAKAALAAKFAPRGLENETKKLAEPPPLPASLTGVAALRAATDIMAYVLNNYNANQSNIEDLKSASTGVADAVLACKEPEFSEELKVIAGLIKSDATSLKQLNENIDKIINKLGVEISEVFTDERRAYMGLLYALNAKRLLIKPAEEPLSLMETARLNWAVSITSATNELNDLRAESADNEDVKFAAIKIADAILVYPRPGLNDELQEVANLIKNDTATLEQINEAIEKVYLKLPEEMPDVPSDEVRAYGALFSALDAIRVIMESKEEEAKIPEVTPLSTMASIVTSIDVANMEGEALTRNREFNDLEEELKAGAEADKVKSAVVNLLAVISGYAGAENSEVKRFVDGITDALKGDTSVNLTLLYDDISRVANGDDKLDGALRNAINITENIKDYIKPEESVQSDAVVAVTIEEPTEELDVTQHPLYENITLATAYVNNATLDELSYLEIISKILTDKLKSYVAYAVQGSVISSLLVLQPQLKALRDKLDKTPQDEEILKLVDDLIGDLTAKIDGFEKAEEVSALYSSYIERLSEAGNLTISGTVSADHEIIAKINELVQRVEAAAAEFESFLNSPEAIANLDSDEINAANSFISAMRAENQRLASLSDEQKLQFAIRIEKLAAPEPVAVVTEQEKQEATIADLINRVAELVNNVSAKSDITYKLLVLKDTQPLLQRIAAELQTYEGDKKDLFNRAYQAAVSKVSALSPEILQADLNRAISKLEGTISDAMGLAVGVQTPEEAIDHTNTLVKHLITYMRYLEQVEPERIDKALVQPMLGLLEDIKEFNNRKDRDEDVVQFRYGPAEITLDAINKAFADLTANPSLDKDSEIYGMLSELVQVFHKAEEVVIIAPVVLASNPTERPQSVFAVEVESNFDPSPTKISEEVNEAIAKLQADSQTLENLKSDAPVDDLRKAYEAVVRSAQSLIEHPHIQGYLATEVDVSLDDKASDLLDKFKDHFAKHIDEQEQLNALKREVADLKLDENNPALSFVFSSLIKAAEVLISKPALREHSVSEPLPPRLVSTSVDLDGDSPANDLLSQIQVLSRKAGSLEFDLRDAAPNEITQENIEDATRLNEEIVRLVEQYVSDATVGTKEQRKEQIADALEAGRNLVEAATREPGVASIRTRTISSVDIVHDLEMDPELAHIRDLATVATQLIERLESAPETVDIPAVEAHAQKLAESIVAYWEGASEENREQRVADTKDALIVCRELIEVGENAKAKLEAGDHGREHRSSSHEIHTGDEISESDFLEHHDSEADEDDYYDDPDHEDDGSEYRPRTRVASSFVHELRPDGREFVDIVGSACETLNDSDPINLYEVAEKDANNFKVYKRDSGGSFSGEYDERDEILDAQKVSGAADDKQHWHLEIPPSKERDGQAVILLSIKESDRKTKLTFHELGSEERARTFLEVYWEHILQDGADSKIKLEFDDTDNSKAAIYKFLTKPLSGGESPEEQLMLTALKSHFGIKEEKRSVMRMFGGRLRKEYPPIDHDPVIAQGGNINAQLFAGYKPPPTTLIGRMTTRRRRDPRDPRRM